MANRYPVTGEATRVLGVLIDEHLDTIDKYTEDTMHLFNAKLTHLTLQLHGIIPFERIEVSEIPLIEDCVQENKWLVFYWTHISNKRLAKVILHDSLKLIHNPNGKENLHPEHQDWIRFSIYSITQQDAFAVFDANREIFLKIEFDRITVKGSRMEPDPRKSTAPMRKRQLPEIHWTEDKTTQKEPMLEIVKIEDLDNSPFIS